MLSVLISSTVGPGNFKGKDLSLDLNIKVLRLQRCDSNNLFKSVSSYVMGKNLEFYKKNKTHPGPCSNSLMER